MSEFFSFEAAQALSDACAITADKIDVCNGQMEKRFGELGEYFRDGGYEEYALDMTSADKAISDVVAQLKHVGQTIRKYAEELKRVQ